MIANMSAESSDIKAISEKISLDGWSDGDGLFHTDLLLELREEVRLHEFADALSLAHTGHNESKMLSAVRGDSTLWLDDPRCGDASKKFLVLLDILRIELNRSLMLGLVSVEAHYAAYPAGAVYGRHRDSFRDNDARVLSLVCYLNTEWPDNAGGALRLHLTEGHRDIEPKLGTNVIFLSGDIEHEVMPSTQTRYSIAAWFRQREIQLR